MHKSKTSQAFAMLPLLVLQLLGCSSSNPNPGTLDSDADGQVTETWQDYCVATFTADYAVKDDFGDTQFTARTGEAYLLSEYGAGFDNDHASLLYLTKAGPMEFDIDVPTGSRAFPFSSACGFDAALEYYAVFGDTAVFTSEELTDKLCDLDANSVVARDPARSSGFIATALNLNGPTTYQVMLNAFSDGCGGAEEGYVSVPSTKIFGSTTWLVPVRTILGPPLSPGVRAAIRQKNRTSRALSRSTLEPGM